MIGQTAEGLGTDDVGHALVDQLEHFRGQEPPLAHLRALADIAADALLCFIKIRHRHEVRIMLLHHTADIALFFQQEAVQEFGAERLERADSVEVVVDKTVVHAVQAEVDKARDNRLDVFFEQELFEVVVA